ncbi:unnamed protein product [Linum trigynum]|uniref:Transposase MuDR plant domain-containing protein n=1 Tax=Linum trigynum TaxID=586398 RepID=A0AAV2FKB6_9ROSI
MCCVLQQTLNEEQDMLQVKEKLAGLLAVLSSLCVCAQDDGTSGSTNESTTAMEDGGLLLRDDIKQVEEEVEKYHRELDSDTFDEYEDANKYEERVYQRYNPDTPAPSFQEGMEFASIQVAKYAIRDHAVKDNKNLRLVTNSKKVLKAKCRWPDCEFSLIVRFVENVDKAVLRSYKPHNFPTHVENRCIDAEVIAAIFKDRLLTIPRLTSIDIQKMVEREMGVGVSGYLCNKAQTIVETLDVQPRRSERIRVKREQRSTSDTQELHSQDFEEDEGWSSTID